MPGGHRRNCNHWLLSVQRADQHAVFLPAKKVYQVVDLALAELLQRMNKLEFTTVWGKLFQKTLFERVRFLAGHGYEDTMTVSKLYLQATKIVYV